MKELFEHIERLKKQLEKLQPLSLENQQRLDKKFRLEWNFNSNHIEGNTLTYGETELLLIFGETKGNHEFREYEEMKGHDIALKLIEDLSLDNERNLTENFIRELNKVILKEPFYKEALTPDGQQTRRQIKIGDYKSFPNSVRLQNGEIFNYASPAETPILMADLLTWYHEVCKENILSPIEVAAELHYRFVCIHPFDDGNGRISRLLMNYHLLKNGYPPVIIKSADKKSYLFALHEADTGNLGAFQQYIGEQLIWSYEISIKAAEGKNIDEDGDWEKEIELLRKETQKKTEAKKEKSKATTLEIFSNSLKPLIEELLSKTKSLEEFYQKSDTSYLFNNKNTISNKSIEEVIQLMNSFDEEDDEINTLGFSLVLKKFKRNDTNTFNSYCSLNFRFDELFYSTTINNEKNKETRKLNNEYFSKDEINSMVSFITTQILAEIKQEIKN